MNNKNEHSNHVGRIFENKSKIITPENLPKSEAILYFEDNNFVYNPFELEMYEIIKALHSPELMAKYDEVKSNTVKTAAIWREIGNKLNFSHEKTKHCMNIYRSYLYKFRKLVREKNNNSYQKYKHKNKHLKWKWFKIFEETLPLERHISDITKQKTTSKNKTNAKLNDVLDELEGIKLQILRLIKKL
ncbi:hypothetical protein EHP00_1161 [Ecytonucleospora hepatopenaei]|uniref:MADF domain-containing protein n=1 Tax=Ecytonucleospora hepatopenaei TaxID=646526 RepID=A0A1W0E4E6_9MICR|nr:hypothetical protein EHP00_1161 [Ecytonucleospora hepatopenaei]